jgi:hypothetical protein
MILISSCVSKPHAYQSATLNPQQSYEQCLTEYSRDIAAVRCEGLFNNLLAAKELNNKETKANELSRTEKLTVSEIETFAKNKILSNLEFKFIRAEAEKIGMRVWMFGGTASSYLHYAKWDLLRQKGLSQLQADRFDYDFTNIFKI